jgi:protein dithiol oxidoreductase (disulfide-forming)
MGRDDMRCSVSGKNNQGIAMRVAALLAGLMALGVAQLSGAAAPVEGRDYQRLSLAQPTSDPKKVVVTEFFSYQCPHCYSFAQPFEAWMRKLPPDVMVERIPVSLGRKAWEPTARAYLVFASMQMLPKMDAAIFDAIHRQGMRLDTEQALVQWVGTQRIDPKEFASLYRSFGVDTQMKVAEGKARAQQIPSIPAVVVDGKYLVAIEDNGSFQGQLAVIDELIARARREKGAK